MSESTRALGGPVEPIRGTNRPGRDSRENVNNHGELDAMTIGEIASLVMLERQRRTLVYGAFQVVGSYIERAKHSTDCKFKPARGRVARSCTCGLADARAAMGIRDEVEG